MFAIKEAEECVIDEYLCLTGGATLHPSACPKKLHNIFSNLLLKLTFNLQAGRKKEKTDNVASVWSSCSPGNIIINCCQAKPLSPILCDEIWLQRSEMRDSRHFLMFTFPNKGDTLDFFLRQVSLSFSLGLWCLIVSVLPDSVFTREPLHGQSALWHLVAPSVGLKNSKMNVSQQQHVVP